MSRVQAPIGEWFWCVGRSKSGHAAKRNQDKQGQADRVLSLAAVEQSAEILSVHQMDLLAQLEGQLRAARHTLIAINRLRDRTHRVGQEPTNGERTELLIALSDEISVIDQNLLIQHQTCLDQQRLIREMQARLTALKVRVPDKI